MIIAFVLGGLCIKCQLQTTIHIGTKNFSSSLSLAQGEGVIGEQRSRRRERLPATCVFIILKAQQVCLVYLRFLGNKWTVNVCNLAQQQRFNHQISALPLQWSSRLHNNSSSFVNRSQSLPNGGKCKWHRIYIYLHININVRIHFLTQCQNKNQIFTLFWGPPACVFGGNAQG